MSSQPQAMIYGANGYTARLIAQQAVARGLQPILAGRNFEAVLAVASPLDLPAVAFDLRNSATLAEKLSTVSVLLNCAGPFSQTARVLIESCMASHTDYMDITGEIDVIVSAHTHHEQARAAGVALIPAVGFDVVPTDCLAAMLAERLPGARLLQLAFAGSGAVSPGTAKTMIETLPTGGRARIDGEIRRVPMLWKTMDVAFRRRTLSCTTIPWGDVASGYYSTGIPNIEVYTGVRSKQLDRLRQMRALLPLLGWKPVQNMAKWWIDRTNPGPTEQDRQSGSMLWGRVTDEQGKQVTATMETMSGYELTAHTAVAALERALARQISPGYSTPSQAFGKEFILSFPKTDVKWE